MRFIFQHAVHILLSSVLWCLDPIGKKSHQQHIWHHHMNFFAHPCTCIHIFSYLFCAWCLHACVCVCVHTHTHTHTSDTQLYNHTHANWNKENLLYITWFSLLIFFMSYISSILMILRSYRCLGMLFRCINKWAAWLILICWILGWNILVIMVNL